jgi:hypothetical protein
VKTTEFQWGCYARDLGCPAFDWNFDWKSMLDCLSCGLWQSTAVVVKPPKFGLGVAAVERWFGPAVAGHASAQLFGPAH